MFKIILSNFNIDLVLTSRASELFVVAGTIWNYDKKIPKESIYEVGKHTRHPGWSDINKLNDIGMLWLIKPLNMTEGKIQKITLESRGMIPGLLPSENQILI